LLGFRPTTPERVRDDQHDQERRRGGGPDPARDHGALGCTLGGSTRASDSTGHRLHSAFVGGAVARLAFM
jgi:hypothetical protein